MSPPDKTAAERSTATAPPTSDRRAGAAWWAPAVVVAVGAAVATAHGLFEVARAAGAPDVIAGLYPLITDGLALVAYAATTRLSGSGRRYAWSVVVLAAGLSGLAQATYLAGAVTPDAAIQVGAEHTAAADAVEQHSVPAGLRFGVGAWPAVAAAIVAHLLFLLATARHVVSATETAQDPLTESGGADGVSHPVKTAEPDCPSVGGAQACPTRALDTRPLIALESVQPLPSDTGSDGVDIRLDGHPASNTPSNSASNSAPSPADVVASVSPRERARAVAEDHRAERGELPTARQLAEAAGVSRGTAAAALQTLRDSSSRPPQADSSTNGETP